MGEFSELKEKALSRATHREINVLLSCACTQMDDRTSSRVEALIQQELDWAFLLSTARLHALIPLLYLSLRQFSPAHIPKSARDELRLECQQVTLLIHLQVRQLLALLTMFRDHGIQAISFKGPALGMLAYGDATRRCSGDIDLLIRRKDFPSVRELLLERGYVQPAKCSREDQYLKHRGASPFYTTSRGTFDVDVHVTLEQRPFDSFPFSCKLSTERMWERCGAVSIEGVSVRTLSAEDSLLHLCCEGAKDSWARLAKVCDLAELIRRRTVDWTQIVQRARDMHTERILCLGLLLARGLLGTELPEYVDKIIERNTGLKLLALQVCGRMFDPANPALKKVGSSFSEAASHHFFRMKLLERPHEKTLYPIFRGLRKLSKIREGRTSSAKSALAGE